MLQYKDRALEYYQKNEVKFQIGFFLAGLLFDVFTTGDIDDWVMLSQQVFYLLLIAAIMSLEHLTEAGLLTIRRGAKLWEYRSLILHFSLGNVLNIYSIFFLKSASVFNSFIFVLALVTVVIANELPAVQKSGVNIRWALWVLCLFCFFTVIFPLALGFVGWLPFLLSAVATAAILYLHLRWMMKKQPSFQELSRSFLEPGLAVVVIFIGLYFFRLIPPVPLAANSMGVYHDLQKAEGQFVLSHERPWWRFWETGDQTFKARAGDQIFFFAQIFSPARFSDEVTIHWLYKDPRAGWMTSDKVRMQITGGRKQGFRGYSVKRNYTPGDWRVQIETTDGREIGRLYVEVIRDESTDERQWTTERL